MITLRKLEIGGCDRPDSPDRTPAGVALGSTPSRVGIDNHSWQREDRWGVCVAARRRTAAPRMASPAGEYSQVRCIITTVRCNTCRIVAALVAYCRTAGRLAAPPYRLSGPAHRDPAARTDGTVSRPSERCSIDPVVGPRNRWPVRRRHAGRTGTTPSSLRRSVDWYPRAPGRSIAGGSAL